jgi:DNA topoisomerase-3
MIEKLIALGLAERKKLLKNMYIMPTQAGTALATILPEQLQSPLLTAEWEHRLLLVERGELSPDDFRAEVADMVGDIVRNYQKLPGSEALFPDNRPVVGNCPRCGKPVRAFRKGFFCTDRCGFGLYKEDRFFARKKITLTEEQVAALLKDGAVRIDGIYSEKTGNLYSADVLMEDTGKYVNYRLAFDRKEEGKA